ncbi:SDR family NAD(P)-dependent oxidoreductase [Chloroflexota bacterium]
MGRLGNKIAIVTGGSKGIGKAISLAFARDGADVVVAARTEAALEEVASEIRGMGRKSLAIVTELGESEQPLVMVNRTLEVFGRIDVLVNNAGVEGPTVEVADMDLEAWNYVLAINLTAAMLCTKYVLKKSMIPQQNGNIINISSGMGRRGSALRSPYSASKAAMIGFTQSLASELGKYHIRVNCIAPGAVEGPRIERVWLERSKALGITFEEVAEKRKSQSPLGKIVKPEEVAALAVFLASEESSGLTGQTISCSAGAWMY